MSRFVLAARLHGHSSDVRAIASHTLSNGTQLILSGSRDQSARLWVRRHDGTHDVHVLDHGSGFVNAVAFFVHDTGIYALTAGQDALIYAYHIDTDGPVSVSGSPTLSLVGHASNVCSLRTHSAYIVSGSWDSTVRVWKNWECVATLAGHSHSVWSVLPIDEDRILSASADKTVCLWSISSPKEPLYVFEGATQAVRDIARVSDTAFVSAGNDGQLRLYPIHGGAPYKTFASLPAFVYALAPLADGFVSSGEDRCVRVWAHDALTQLVPVPALSVWCVCTLSNGDMACGASDGTVTIFTRDAARAALLPEQEAFAADIATQSLSAPEVQGVRVCEEHDTTPGASEGDVLVVRQGSKSTRYHWSTHTQQWIPTGIVTEGASSSQKTLFEGKAYDYVFDVDIADGVPPLKLPYNVTDNAYVAASQFLERHQLPASFLDQVVRFLEKNTGVVDVSTTEAVDPYTGTSRYVPAQPAPLATLPQTRFLSFTHVQLASAHAKMLELSQSVPGATLSDDDQTAVAALVAALEQGTGVMPVDILGKLLRTWPLAARFPLLDLLRAAALHACTQPLTTLVSDALVGADWDGLDQASDVPSAPANAMLALRTLANAFVAPQGPATMASLALEALATLHQPPWHVLNRAGHTALATVALNYSILAVTQPTFEHAALLLDILTDVRFYPLTRQILRHASESESVYRALVALGNLVRMYN